MGATPVETDSINGIFWLRLLTLTAIKLCKRWRPRHGAVLFLSRKICVKYGYFQNVSEAATMQFIARNTSIPVPKIYCAFKHDDWTYIVMERIDGQKLGQGWSLRTKESRHHLLGQLKGMVTEMRSIPAPEKMGVASVSGGSLYDGRLPKPPGDSLRVGPFDNIAEFHLYLRRGIEANPNHFPAVNELMELHRGTWPLCFTHADLSSLNILVRDDNVIGIVDWETAG